MAGDAKYNVHDIGVSEQPFFGPGGVVGTQKVVTFYVGNHGPFIRRWKIEDATPSAIQLAITQQVDELRTLDSMVS